MTSGAPPVLSRVPVAWALVLGVCAVSTAGVLIRLADDAPTLAIAAYRMAIASAVIGPIALLAGSRVPPRPLANKDVALMAVSGLLLAVHFGLWIGSLKYTSVASSVVLVTSSPLLVAVASRFLLNERAARGEVLGIVLGLIGGGVIAAGDVMLGGRELLGDALAFGGAAAAAGYLMVGRRVRAAFPTLAYAGIAYSVAAIALVAAALAASIGLGSQLAGFGGETLVWLVLIALVPQTIGHTSLNWALGHVSATGVAIAIMGEPIGASALAWLVLGEAPSPAVVAGAAFLLSGVYLALRGAADRSTR